MTPSLLVATTIRSVPDYLETGSLALRGTTWGHRGGSTWASARGDRRVAGCPTIVVQPMSAMVNQNLIIHGWANRPRYHECTALPGPLAAQFCGIAPSIPFPCREPAR
jgi:hypothetical protein